MLGFCSRNAHLLQVVPGFSCILISRDFWKEELDLPARHRLLVHVVISVAAAGHTAGRLSSRWLRHRVRVQMQEVSCGSRRPVSDRLDKCLQSVSVFSSDPRTQLLHLSDVCSQLLQGDRGEAVFSVSLYVKLYLSKYNTSTQGTKLTIVANSLAFSCWPSRKCSY